MKNKEKPKQNLNCTADLISKKIAFWAPFWRGVHIKNQSIAEGWGKSMKHAEKDAANNALKSLDANKLDI